VADRYFSTRDLPDRLSEVLGTLPIAF
jgi:hypothetical protein